MDKRQQTDRQMDMRQQTNRHMDERQQTNRHMDDRQQTDRHMDMKQQKDIWTAKGTLGVYFGMSDKPYFDPYIFGKLHLKIHNTVR